MIHRLAATLSIAFVALSPTLLAQSKPTPADERKLANARSEFEQPGEAACQRGTAACVELNSPESVAAMLEVLNETKRRPRRLAPAHFRDIVFGGLRQITNIYAQRRVEYELRKNKKNAFVRQWCAELLGIYGDGGFASSLMKATSDRSDGVKQWAAWSLGRLRVKESAKPLHKLVGKKNIFIRANAIEALARIDAKTYLESFVLAIKNDEDAGVRCALLGAAPELCPDQVSTLSAAALHDMDWRPRMQAIENFSTIKTKISIDNLIIALEDGRPVIADRAMTYLQKLTAKPIKQVTVWKQWWADNRETFSFPEGDEENKKLDTNRTVTYMGLPVVSDHVAFMIDRSYQMKGRLKSKGMSKQQAAAEELSAVLTKLEGRLTFNVWNYHEEVISMRKKPVALDAKSKKRALKFVVKKSDGIAKDIWQLLETVIEDPTLDTAYLLSSGEPDIGTYVHWNRVTAHMKDLNRFYKVTVHTVCYSNSKWFRDQLEKIAQVTGGEFKWFE